MTGGRRVCCGCVVGGCVVDVVSAPRVRGGRGGAAQMPHRHDTWVVLVMKISCRRWVA